MGLIQHFRHGQIARRKSADNAFPTGEYPDTGTPRPIPDGQKPEQDRQAQEYKLDRPVLSKSSEPHKKGKKSPHKEIPAHICRWSTR